MIDEETWYQTVKLTSIHDPNEVWYVGFSEPEYPSGARAARVSAAAGPEYVGKMVQAQLLREFSSIRVFNGYGGIAYDTAPPERPDVQQ